MHFDFSPHVSGNSFETYATSCKTGEPLSWNLLSSDILSVYPRIFSEYMSVLSQVRQYGIRALNKQINRLDGSCGHGKLSERNAHVI